MYLCDFLDLQNNQKHNIFLNKTNALSFLDLSNRQVIKIHKLHFYLLFKIALWNYQRKIGILIAIFKKIDIFYAIK